MKICYTAIIGDYDTLKEPEYITPGWEYVCLTDKNIKSKHWQISMFVTEKNPQKQARWIKINFPDHGDESIWFDASFQIKGNIDELIEHAQDYDGMVMHHPHRKTIYEEADAVIRLNKDKDETVRRQILKYQSEGFKQNSPLVATGIMYRKNNHAIEKFNAIWDDEVMKGSHRDQLSFNYAQQKSGARFLVSSMNIYDKKNKFFLLHKHK